VYLNMNKLNKLGASMAAVLSMGLIGTAAFEARTLSVFQTEADRQQEAAAADAARCAAARTAYAAGDVGEAVALVNDCSDRALAKNVTRLSGLITSTTRSGDTRIKELVDALELDAAVSPVAHSVTQRYLRHALAKLLVTRGEARLKRHHPLAARADFEAAAELTGTSANVAAMVLARR
jgi:hypothetical protein